MKKSLNFFVYVLVYTFIFAHPLFAAGTNVQTVSFHRSNIESANSQNNFTKVKPHPTNTGDIGKYYQGEIPEILLVSTNSSNQNVIEWENILKTGNDSIIIYRTKSIESGYSRIGSIAVNDVSFFTDTMSNANMQEFFYKIAIKDSCGNISPFSVAHKPVHLTISAGLNGRWELEWTEYEGFQVQTYKIYRGTNEKNMTLIDVVSGNQTSYTDSKAPKGNFTYFVEAPLPNSINARKKKGKRNYHTTRSNRANNGGILPVYLTADFSIQVNSNQFPAKTLFSDLSNGNPTSWHWNFGDGDTSTVQNPQHIYQQAGTYTVSLTVCKNSVCDSVSSTLSIQATSMAGYDNQKNIDVIVYPNPSQGQFTLDLSNLNEDNVLVEVYNNVGSIVYSDNLQVSGSFSQEINLQDLAKGVYYMRLQNENHLLMTKRILIQ